MCFQKFCPFRFDALTFVPGAGAHFFLGDAFGKPRLAAGAHTSYMYPENSPPSPPSRHPDDVERFAPERTGISSTASLKAINTSNYNPTTPWFCSGKLHTATAGPK